MKFLIMTFGLALGQDTEHDPEAMAFCSGRLEPYLFSREVLGYIQHDYRETKISNNFFASGTIGLFLKIDK